MELEPQLRLQPTSSKGTRKKERMSDNKQNDQSISELDKALNAATLRKDARDKANGGTKALKEPKAAAEKRPRLTDEEKAAKALQREQDRLAQKAQRAEAKATKLAERNAGKKPAHMKKVEKAAEKLPSLSQEAQLEVNGITSNFGAAAIAAIAQHLQHFNRVKATERALEQPVKAGQQVTVVGGDTKYLGKTGTVTKAQRIRCYIQLEGFSKPVYMFTSDVTVTEATSAAATA